MNDKRREYLKAYQREWRRKRRQDWIDSQGGKCVQCGSPDALEIDHIDRSTKEYNITEIWNRSQTIRDNELAKCQLLCTPCHQHKTNIEVDKKLNPTRMDFPKEVIDLIRSEYAKGGCTHRSLATKYHMSYSHVGRILNCETRTSGI